MVAYSFKAQFVLPIQAGAKKQTIRKARVGKTRHARPGETVQLYTAMRTKFCTLIGTAKCTLVVPVTIDAVVNDVLIDGERIWIRDQLELLACRDGFTCWTEMRDFWERTHGTDPFTGVLIHWTDFHPGGGTSDGPF